MAQVEEEQRSFPEMYTKLIESLSYNDKVKETLKILRKSIPKIIQYTRNLVELPQNVYVLKNPRITQKYPEIAKEYRLKGDSLIASGSFSKAIEWYNKSIINAEFVVPAQNNDEIVENDMELSYMGRANCLFRMGLKNECKIDITRALEHGDGTTKTGDEIFNRYRSNNKNVEAYNNILNLLSKLPPGNYDDLIIEDLRVNIEREKTIINIEETFEIAPGKEYVTPPAVELPIILDRNPNIPCLSSAVHVECLDKRNRYLYARRNIEPGELLIYEDRFVSVLYHEYLHTHCTYCLSRAYLPIPCPSCVDVVYCCEECRESAWGNFHSVECKILPILRLLELRMCSLLSLRLAIFIGFKSLKNNIPTFKKEVLRLKSRTDLGFSRRGIYSSNDYRSIYSSKWTHNLQGSFLFLACVSAHVLLDLLEMSDYFKVNDSLSSQRDKEFIHEVLVDQILISLGNACSIRESVVKDGNIMTDRVIGASLSSVYSLANHSCNPMSHVFFYPNAIAVRATKFIPKHQEITISYCNTFGFLQHNLKTRRDFLELRYQFDCICGPCINNWQNMVRQIDDVILVCNSCRRGFWMQFGKCPNCSLPLEDEFDVCEELRDIFTSREWKIAANSVEACKDVEVVKRAIRYLCKFSVQPCKHLYLAQIILKRFYDNKASRHIEPPTSSI